MKWLVAFLLCLVLSPLLQATTAAQGYRFADDPEGLIVAEASGSEGAATSSDGLSYLQVIDQVVLTGPEPVWHRQVSYQVNEERGLADAGQISLYFQPAYQRIEIHAVDVWRDGEQNDRRSTSRIETLRRESELESGLLDGSLTLSITIPDIRLGDRVAYRYSVVGYNPVFGAGYHDTFTARYSTPLALREVRYIYPESMQLRWKADIEGFTTKHRRQDGAQVLEVSARGLKAVTEEDGMPSTFNPNGLIEVSTATSWRDVIDWGMPLYPRGLRDRKLATPFVQRLQLDPADPMGSALRATAFVQGEVRYTGVDMGQNSHAPNAPELVLERRFGDCKDKTTLLIALLAEAGVHADPVLVNTEQRETVRNRLPSPLAFNHVIVRARVAGRDVWIDPTLDRERGSFLSRQPLSFRVGLPLAADTVGLVEIPYPAPDGPLVDVRQKIDFGIESGRLTAAFVVATAYRQAFAASVRDGFSSRGAENMGKAYLEYMQGYYEGLQSDAKPSLSEKGSGVSVAERYQLAWSEEESGSQFGIVLFQVLDWLPKLAESARLTPLALGGPRYGSHTISSSHAGSWSIEKETEVVENAYFRFDRRIEVKDNLLVVSGDWRRFSDEVPAADVELVRKDLARVRDLAQYDVDLAPPLAIFSASFKDWLWPLAYLGLAAVALAGMWLLRRRVAFAGMFYRPRQTVTDFQARGGVGKAGLVLVLLSIMLDVAIEFGPKIATQSVGMAWGILVGGLIAMGLRWVAWSGLMKLAFRMLGQPLVFSDLLKSAGWACAPMLLLTTLAILVLKFDLSLLDEANLAAGKIPAVVVAFLLMLLGMGWSMVSMVNAYAGLAVASRRRALAATALAMGIALAVLVPLVLLVVAVR